MFVNLAGRRCVVVGGGAVAELKIASLLQAGGCVRVIAPQGTSAIADWSGNQTVEWLQRAFKPADVIGAIIVVAATDSAEVNASVARACRDSGALCNLVDDPDQCDFHYPAVVRRGPLQIAISTGGLSPAVAQRLREELEEQFGPEYEEWLNHVGELRRQVLSSDLDSQQRAAELSRIASHASFEKFVRNRATHIGGE